MLEIPRIALFYPNDDESRKVLRCFPRETYSIRLVDGVEQILSLMAEEASAFDVIIVPPKTRAGDSGAYFISQARSTTALQTIPLIALCDDQQPDVLRTLHAAGVELVVSTSVEPDLLLCQIRALHRLHSSIRQDHEYALELGGLRDSTAKALNCTREGILLFTPSKDLAFLNAAAGRLLGIVRDTPSPSISSVGSQFSGLIAAHEASISQESLAGDKQPATLPMSLTEFTAQRLSGEFIKILARVVTLQSERGEMYGTTIALTDLSEFATLAAQVQQNQRTRSLCLLATAGCIQLARGGDPIRATSAADLLQKVVQRDPPRCSLSNVTTVFLEMLDVIAPTGVQVRVKFDKELTLALRPAELFQVIGHLVLEGIDFCGERGTIEIIAVEIPGVQSVRITIAAESTRTAPFAPSDYFSSLLQGSTTIPGESSSTENDSPLAYGVAAVRQILTRYEGTPVSQDHPNDKTLLLRVILPVLGKT